MKPKDIEEIRPHRYKPDTLPGMGGCKVCGRLQGDPIHNPDKVEAEEPRAYPRCFDSIEWPGEF